MKKLLVTVIAFLAISTSVFAQADEMKKGASYILDEKGELVETTAPIFNFEKETHSFGDIEEGPKVEYEFKFTNDGKEPLIISNVKASCGCTTPSWPKDPIMPGEEAAIKAIYNTSKRMGPFNKSITITSNAYTPTKRLYIKGKVVKGGDLEKEEMTPMKKKSIVEEK